MNNGIFFPGGPQSRRAKLYRNAVQELCSTSAPRVLTVLDEVEIPEEIELGLRHWLGTLMLPDPTPALAPAALGEAYTRLSVLFLSAHTFEGRAPKDQRLARTQVDLILTQQADADSVRLAQLNVATILVNGHGPIGAEHLAAADAKERENLRRMSRMIARRSAG